MTQTADVIVIGLGAQGSAAACRLARRGAKVIGLDRFAPPHEMGSSHGASRITREAIGEGEIFVPLARRAHQLWRELEAESGERLMLTTGALIIGRQDAGAIHTGKVDFVRQTIAAARRFGIAHEVLTPAEATRRYPVLRPDADEAVYFEPGAGVLFPERCIAVHLGLARRHGARINTGETVLAIAEEGEGVRVTTDKASYGAGQVVLAAGAWTPGLAGPETAAKLTVWRQVMHWFEPADPAPFAPDRFPVFIWMHGGSTKDWFYGFPLLPGQAGMKIAEERFDSPLAGPRAQTQDVDPAEPAAMWAHHIAPRIAGVSDRCVRSLACLYTMAPGGRFLIGRDRARERVIVVSACSGHGFKHSAAIGELVADLALDAQPPALLAPFALDAPL